MISLSVKVALENEDTSELEVSHSLAANQDDADPVYASRDRTFPRFGYTSSRKIIAREMKSDGPILNLSRYALSSSQVLQILASFSDDIKTLDLSYNEDIKADTVRQIQTSCPDCNIFPFSGVRPSQMMTSENCSRRIQNYSTTSKRLSIPSFSNKKHPTPTHSPTSGS
jgi:hypothetical protein